MVHTHCTRQGPGTGTRTRTGNNGFLYYTMYCTHHTGTRTGNHFYWPQPSWTNLMFLQASVILSTGGGCLLQCMLGCHTPREQTPPRSRHPPWEQTPPEQTPPGSRHTPPGADPPRADTPTRADTPQEQTPPLSRHPLGADTPRSRPPGTDTPGVDTPWKQTPPGSRLRHTVNDAGTHPTGMHSCFVLCPSRSLSFSHSRSCVVCMSHNTDADARCEWYNWNQCISFKYHRETVATGVNRTLALCSFLLTDLIWMSKL